MDDARYATRRERLRPLIRKQGLGGLLVTWAANRFYLSGFELHDAQCNESSGWLLISTTEGGADDWLLTDPRYEDMARRLWPSERIFIYSASTRALTRTFLRDCMSGRGALGFESKAMSVDRYNFLSEELPLTPSAGLVEELRLIKDEAEVAALARSAGQNHAVFARMPELLVPGRSEREVAWEIEKLFRESGASELAFAPIVAVNRNAALPHAIPGDTRIEENSLVLVDIGGRLDDYCSDQTRTFWIGERPSDRFQQTLARVQEAQQEAIDVIRPGIPASLAYQQARDCFARHGLAERFTHSLGHGIGLETHEAPGCNAASETMLAPGMVMTVEPGLYYPGWGGVRWEYMLLITEDGARVL